MEAKNLKENEIKRLKLPVLMQWCKQDSLHSWSKNGREWEKIMNNVKDGEMFCFS